MTEEIIPFLAKNTTSVSDGVFMGGYGKMHSYIQ